MNEARLIDIEIKLAYQEDTLQALNAALIRQQKDIDELTRTCRALEERLSAALAYRPPPGAAAPGSERPPHY